MEIENSICRYCGNPIESHNLLESIYWVHCDTFSQLCEDPHKAEPVMVNPIPEIPKEEFNTLLQDHMRRMYDWDPQSGDEHFEIRFRIMMEKNPKLVRRLICEHRDVLELRDE